jgi:hypothetical protein
VLDLARFIPATLDSGMRGESGGVLDPVKTFSFAATSCRLQDRRAGVAVVSVETENYHSVFRFRIRIADLQQHEYISNFELRIYKLFADFGLRTWGTQ